MKIAFFEIKEEEKEFFNFHLKEEHELFFFKETIQDVLAEVNMYDIISVFVNSSISDAILDKLPELSYVQTRSTGYEHLHCDMLYKRGIKVSNVMGYAGPTVAEFSFSLLLNATRKTHISLQRSQNDNFSYHDLKGIELFGKTIGILGLGTIGLQMAKIAKGFGMKVLGYSRTYKPVYDEVGIDFISLTEVLKNADILMLALPLTPATQHIIHSDNVTQIKKECIIINAARCEIIEKSLYWSLENIIASDVCCDRSLTQKKSFLFTPHMAYYTYEALERIMDISLENIQVFLSGKEPPNCLKIACKKEY